MPLPRLGSAARVRLNPTRAEVSLKCWGWPANQDFRYVVTSGSRSAAVNETQSKTPHGSRAQLPRPRNAIGGRLATAKPLPLQCCRDRGIASGKNTPQPPPISPSSKEMTIITRIHAIVIASLGLIAPALADDAAPDNDHGRYTFGKIDEGFLRTRFADGCGFGLQPARRRLGVRSRSGGSCCP